MEIRNEANDSIRQVREEAASDIRDAQEKAEADLEAFKAQFLEHIKELEETTKEAKSHDEEQKDKIAQLEAELLSIRVAKGESTAVDFNSEDAFDRLEQLKADFDAFFEKAWKEAKKQIRKDTLKRKKKK